MKKFLSLFMLMLLMAGFSAKAADEIYGDFIHYPTHTLTIYYDDKREERHGLLDWYNSGDMHSISTAVLDPSMKNARPTSTAQWFYGCDKLEDIQHLDYLNTSEVTDMNRMFCGCRILNSIDLSSFNTWNVTNMECMFYDCRILKSIDLSSFNTVNVTNMSEMFYGCLSLNSSDEYKRYIFRM